MAKENDLKAEKASHWEEVAGNVCDTMDATLNDIYEKVAEQARLGRSGMNYQAYLSSYDFYKKIRKILNKKGYLINHVSDIDCIYSLNIFWHGLPF